MQHFAGTRTALDFVEVPALLLEEFAWDPRVRLEIAAHIVSRRGA